MHTGASFAGLSSSIVRIPGKLRNAGDIMSIFLSRAESQ